jgi:hypothetical protein
MSWFSGRIDPSTGRNKRDKGPVKDREGMRPQRHNGKIVRGGRLEFQRGKVTGKQQSKSWW